MSLSYPDRQGNHSKKNLQVNEGHLEAHNQFSWCAYLCPGLFPPPFKQQVRFSLVPLFLRLARAMLVESNPPAVTLGLNQK